MSKIVVVSDFSFAGSGYLNIIVPLCKGLVEKGHEIKAIGLGYRGEPHNFPFSIIPCSSLADARVMANHLVIQWKADLLLVAMDIPVQLQYIALAKQLNTKIISITPLENPPLTMSWALPLQESNKVFFISQLGADEAQKAGVESAEHLVVGMDTASWRMRTNEEYERGRETFAISPDTLVVLTVADNQERKNLSKAMEIVSKVKKQGVKVKYILVTREHSDVGWKLRDLALDYNIASELMIFERGLSFGELYSLYAISDVFLLTSKAEGLCCLPSQKVWSDRGILPISEVRAGDLVISHTGDMELVEEVFERKINEKVNRIEMGFGLPPIEVTDNHLVLGYHKPNKRILNSKWSDVQMEWIPSQNLNPKDFVFYPRPETREVDSVCPADFLSGISDFEINGNFISPVGYNQSGKRFIHSRGKSLPLTVPISQDFMQSIGWYISEGCDTGEGLSFSLNSSETAYQEEIRGLMNSLYGLELKDKFRERNRYDGRVYHTMLGKWYSSMCGDGAENKRIPDFALHLPDNQLWPMVYAMFSGDGTIDFKSRCMRYSTVSPLLATQLQHVLLKLGVVSSLRVCKNRTEYVISVRDRQLLKVPFVNGLEVSQKAQQQFIQVDGGWLFPIRKVEKIAYTGKVYNLEVSPSHSYLTSGGVVHNCLPVMEAMSIGVPVVATNCGAMPELMGNETIGKGSGDGIHERGSIMQTEYYMIDPWGNSRRDFPNAEDGATKLEAINRAKDGNGILSWMVDNARKYMESRTWDKPVEQVNGAIKEILDEK